MKNLLRNPCKLLKSPAKRVTGQPFFSLRPPCRRAVANRQIRVLHRFLNQLICQAKNLLFSLRPPCRRGQRVLHRFLNQLICQFMIKFSLRNCRKILKSLGIFTPPPPPALRHKLTRGLGLIEVLVGGAIGSVVVAGSMKSLQLSLESAQVVRSSLSESELRFSLAQILTNEEDCKANLKPTADNVPDPKAVGLYGAKRDWGRGEVVQLKKNIGNNVAGDASTEADDILLVEQGVSFKGDLNIVKMALKGSSTEDDDNNPKKGLRTRTFVVYYKKEGMGSFSTLGGEPCTESDQTGCYFNQCQVEYQLQDQANPEVTKCAVADCVNYGSGGSGGNVECYHADTEDDGNIVTGKGRTLIGCGGTEGITASQTTAVGFSAGSSASTGRYNVFIGTNAGKTNTSGSDNVFIGMSAGIDNTTGVQNMFLGAHAGNKNISGSKNVFIGKNAGHQNTKGANNVAIGDSAGYSLSHVVNTDNTITGGGNTFIGTQAGYHNTTGVQNMVIGFNAGYHNTSGHNNAFIGTNAGNKTTSNSNTFIGSGAGFENITGAGNTFIGMQAGNKTTGGENTFIGSNAGYSMTGEKNTVIGQAVGYKSGGTFITGNNNIAIGYGSKLPSETGDGGNQQLNIGNLIIGRQPASAPTFDSTATTTTDMPQGEVRILGSLKVCDSDGGNCKSPLFSVNDILSKLSTLSCPNGQVYGFDSSGSGSLLCRGAGSGNTSQYAAKNHDHDGQTLNLNRLNVKTIAKNGNGKIGFFNGVTLNAGSTLQIDGSLTVNGYTTFNGATTFNENSNALRSRRNVIFNKNLTVQGDFAYKGTFCDPCSSSRVYKKNITPYNDLEESLQHIIETPLFTYQYKEDRPNKTRMGIISEELPDFLQVKDKGAPSQPDWVSIYGTLWAGIKALFQKFKAFQENTIQEISHIKKQLKALDSKAQKQALELTKQASQMLKEIMDLKAQFKETKKQVEKSQKELSTKAKEQSQNITQLQKELSTKTKEQSQTITQLQKEQDSKIQAQAQIIAKQAQAIEQLKLALEKQSELTDQLKKEHPC